MLKSTTQDTQDISKYYLFFSLLVDKGKPFIIKDGSDKDFGKIKNVKKDSNSEELEFEFRKGERGEFLKYKIAPNGLATLVDPTIDLKGQTSNYLGPKNFGSIVDNFLKLRSRSKTPQPSAAVLEEVHLDFAANAEEGSRLLTLLSTTSPAQPARLFIQDSVAELRAAAQAVIVAVEQNASPQDFIVDVEQDASSSIHGGSADVMVSGVGSEVEALAKAKKAQTEALIKTSEDLRDFAGNEITNKTIAHILQLSFKAASIAGGISHDCPKGDICFDDKGALIGWQKEGEGIKDASGKEISGVDEVKITRCRNGLECASYLFKKEGPSFAGEGSEDTKKTFQMVGFDALVKGEKMTTLLQKLFQPLQSGGAVIDPGNIGDIKKMMMGQPPIQNNPELETKLSQLKEFCQEAGLKSLVSKTSSLAQKNIGIAADGEITSTNNKKGGEGKNILRLHRFAEESVGEAISQLTGKRSHGENALVEGTWAKRVSSPDQSSSSDRDSSIGSI